MLKITLISTAAALVLTGTASGQQIVCAVGYANALSTVGTGVAGTDDEAGDAADGGLNRGALMLASEVECSSKTFLSDDPSLSVGGDGFTDNGRRPWTLMFKGASDGLAGALQSHGYFGNGTGNEGRGPQGVRSGPDDGASANATGNGSAVPDTICEYFGGSNCVHGTGGNGFGSDGTPPGHDLADDHQAFVDAIHSANGPLGGATGLGGNGGSNGNVGGNGNSGAVSDVDAITVVDLIDGNSDAADIAPEPATMTLLASGLVGLAASARRRKKQP